MTRYLKSKMMETTLSALTVGLCLGAVLKPAVTSAQTPEWPKAPGAVFALRNGSNITPVVAFDAKGRDLMAFNLSTRGRSLLGRSNELVCDGGSFHAQDAGTWVGQQVAKSGAFTIEAMITPAEAAPKSPGVVLAFGDDKGEDAALLQDKSGLSLRLGGAKPIELCALEAGKPVHVMVTCGKDKWTAYRDGKPAGSGALTDNAPAWGARQILLGAAWSGAEAWRGRMEAVAVFPRVLTAEEAVSQAAASKALQDGRKPAATVRFKGTLLRQAKTSSLEEIRPYTRSLSVAEYKVDKVLAGEWKQPNIIVLHWMIMDAKRLPIADRKPGAEVELSVEPLDQNPQLESSRRDEISDVDLDAVIFYCEAEGAP
jgi:hypothetical protein